MRAHLARELGRQDMVSLQAPTVPARRVLWVPTLPALLALLALLALPALPALQTLAQPVSWLRMAEAWEVARETLQLVDT